MEYVWWCILCTAGGAVASFAVTKYRIGAEEKKAEKTADKVDVHLTVQDEKLEDHGNRLTAIETAMKDRNRQYDSFRHDIAEMKNTMANVMLSMREIETIIRHRERPNHAG